MRITVQRFSNVSFGTQKSQLLKERSENTVVSGLEDGGPGSKDAFGGDAYFPFLDFAPPVRRSRLFVGLQEDVVFCSACKKM